MKTKTSQKATDPTSTSVGTALVQHYWNNDSTKVWTARELEKAVGDTSSIRSLLAAGHQPFPGWRDFTCETRLVRGGALFRIFNHTPRLAPRRPYGPTDARSLIEAPSPGVLCVVAGVAADGCGADNVWRCLQVESAPLYAAHEAGFATLNGYPVAGIEHAGKYASRPNRLPWVSHMAYDPVIHDHQWNFPDNRQVQTTTQPSGARGSRRLCARACRRVSKRSSRRQAFTVSGSKRIKWRKLAGRQTGVAQVADLVQTASDVAGQVIGGPKALVRRWGAKFVPVQAVVCPCLPPGVKFAAQAAFLY